jgi:F0F1-type ATP synthase assembly protein I
MARDDDDGNWGRNFAHGMEVAVGVGLGYLAGNWIDKRLHWTPWGLYAGVMLGCAAGMYSLIKESVRSNKD